MPAWAPAAAVAVVALAASLAGLGNAFAYDDIPMIELNPRLHGLGRWREILASPYWPPPWREEHYRPFTSLFFALQHAIGGGSPMVFRLVSYLLYAATSVGVYLLGARLLPRGVALGAALLFAAHPVHVEAVAPAVGQSELLVALAGLAMTIHYLDRRRAGWLRPRDWVVLGAWYAMASLAKEHGLTLPAFLLLAEALLLRAPLAERTRRLLPGFAALGALAASLVALRFLVIGGQFSANWVAEAIDGLSLGERTRTMLMVVPEWARLLLWPAHLRLDYAPQEFTASTGWGVAEVTGLLLVVTVLVVVAACWRRAPAVAFGFGWMILALAPVSNILVPTGSLLAERLLFLPSAGVLLAGGGLVAWASGGAPSLRQRMHQVLVAGTSVLVLLGVARSAERHRVWRNEAFLSVRSVQDAPRSYRTQRAYADILFQLGQDSLALDAYARSIALAPPAHVWRVRNDLAERLRARGAREAELEQLRASLAAQPEQPDARGHLVAALLAIGRYAEAGQEAARAAAAGMQPEVFNGLRQVADSAARAGAPPGSVLVRIQTGPRQR